MTQEGARDQDNQKKKPVPNRPPSAPAGLCLFHVEGQFTTYLTISTDLRASYDFHEHIFKEQFNFNYNNAFLDILQTR
jgi:hypothetical protein